MQAKAGVMRLGRAPGSRTARPRLQPREPHPWHPPETEFPAIVPTGTLLLGRSERAAVAITGIWAYVTAGEPPYRGWVAMQEEIAGLSASSTRITAEGSGHYVQLDDPELVLRVIRDMAQASAPHPAGARDLQSRHDASQV